MEKEIYVLLNQWEGIPESTKVMMISESKEKIQGCINELKGYLKIINTLNYQYKCDFESEIGSRFGIIHCKVDEIRMINYSKLDKDILWQEYKWV